MADEYRQYNVAVEVLYDNPPAPPPGVKVLNLGVEVLYAKIPEAAIFNVGVEVLWPSNDVLIPGEEGGEEEIPDEERGIDFAGELNPYRPTIPDEFLQVSEEFYYFTRENQEILRQQHNLTQAGDSTFPYQILLTTHDTKLFNLGTIARFIHPTYGRVEARYVQFDLMDSSPLRTSMPVGLLVNRGKLDWVVTNRIELSHENLVVGVMFQFAIPANKSYGWVICEGANLLALTPGTADDVPVGGAYGWHSTGRLAISFAGGRIFARRIGNLNLGRVMAGDLWIKIESWSQRQLETLIAGSLEDIQNQLTALTQQVENLESLNELVGDVAAIGNQLIILSQNLQLEKQQRIANDNAIKAMINGLAYVTPAQLAAAELTLNTRIDNLTTATNDSLLVLTNSLNQFKDDVYNLNIPALQSMNNVIVNLLGQIAALNDRPLLTIPMVTGEVPPVLVYLDDGSLVLLEIFE